MAASGATPIILYHSTTGAAVPSNTNLAPGELAVNIADMKLYAENSSGTVTLLASADAAAGNFTTVDATNLEVTNIKAKDGTAAATIADSTGVVTVSTQLNVDNLRLDGNTMSSTNTDGNIAITPNGTGEVDISKVDIDAGAIDGTTIGANSAAAATFTDVTLNAQGDVRFADSDSSNWVAFQGPATIASNVTWTLPNADGTTGQVLSTNGSGTLSWASGGGGGGGGTSVTVTQITATAAQTDFSVAYTVGQLSVYLNGALLASADFTATNGTTVVLAAGAAVNDIFTALAYSTVTQISQGNTKVEVTDSGTGKIEFTVDNVEVADFTTGAVVFNETGANQDFRVEGDTNANLLIADAGVDKVGIGTNTFNTNGGVLQVSNGISFPATQSACSDVNTLDDYEEGTWTPTDGSGAGLTFSQNRGSYTKIGREVICYMAVQYPSTANGNNAQINGLPFSAVTAAADSGFGGSISFTNLDQNYAFLMGNGVTHLITHTYAGSRITNATFSTKVMYVVIQYQTST